MKAIHTRGHLGRDGMLAVRVATGLPEMDVDVVLVVQSEPERPDSERAPRRSSRELAGICADAPLACGDQGGYEKREPLD